MSKILNVLLISTSLSFLILGGLYFEDLKENFTHDKEKTLREDTDLVEASKLILLNQPLDAMTLIKKYSNKIDLETPKGKAWLNLLVKASVLLPDNDQLVHIFDYHPDALKGNEKGALSLANIFLADKDFVRYEHLRAFYKKEETMPNEWLILDADSLILQGKPEAAIALLETRYFEGEDDTPRLLRLALLHSNQHPKFAWDYLNQALKKDPKNPDISLFRARLLESSGKNDIAEAEWSRVANQPHTPAWIKEETLDYQLRNHQYKKALNLIETNLSLNMKDSLVLKALFLSKVIEPLPFNFKTKGPSLYSYIANLPEAKFWDESTYTAKADLSGDKKQALAEEQAAYWLVLLQNLKDSRQEDAYTLLEHPTFQGPFWDKELAHQIKSVIHYRLKGSFLPAEETDKNSPEFFKELNSYAKGVTPSSHVQELLSGPEAYSALFLARGWDEAAIKLHVLNSLPDETPEWIAPLYIKVLRENRGIKEALRYANLQRQTATVRLAKAKLLLEDKQFDEGESELESLASLSGFATFRGDEPKMAASILAERLFNKKAWSRVKEVLDLQPTFKKSPKGQEILARIALEEHDENEAEQIYAGIVTDSSEAKSFLAKKAFAVGDYRKAYLLTEALLKSDPHNKILKDNLNLLLKSQTQP